MMKAQIHRAVQRTQRTVSFILVLKGAVGGSVTLLALAGVTVPYLTATFGWHYHQVATQGVAGVLGAVAGVAMAMRA